MLTLTTDSIDISTSGSVRLSLWYFINNTGFESNDNFFASISVDGGSDTFITFREAGGPVVGNDIEGLTGAWTQAISPVFSGNSVVLTFGVDFNSETETLFLDDIGVSTIPEPSTYALILGGLAIGVVIWKRRRS
ncbi:MAG: PEP-CTERM sorting domain-containing protein [Verrucomicrobia bacterium]|nr:PEP-CTERM sorting domain-containing protein [Verrucomicrobiota bacterium]MDA1069140.1 PEP-CTERM sorting domain-containing protein [Verrucomicrobiota bacterium]